jgi:hypothetical protein
MSAASLPELLARGLPAGVAARAQALLRVQAALDRALPAALAGHVRVMQLEQRTLALACDSGAVASRLRHDGTALVEKLDRLGVGVDRLRVGVDPGLLARHAPPVDKPGVPAAALDGLAQLNASIEDGPLKEALTRLLRHHAARR